SGRYDNDNAGLTKTVSVSGLALSGADASNYHLASTTTSGVVGIINPAALTITALTNTKVYDGTVKASAVPIVTGLLGPDTARNLTEVYDNKNVGTGKTLSVSTYTISDGNGGKNYVITKVDNHTGVITAKPVTATLTGSVVKTYDTTT